MKLAVVGTAYVVLSLAVLLSQHNEEAALEGWNQEMRIRMA